MTKPNTTDELRHRLMHICTTNERDLDYIMRLIEDYTQQTVENVCNRAIEELETFTAEHDRPMRDEAIGIIKAQLTKESE